MVNVVDLSIRYKTVHQVNVIQFTQVDGPVVHQMDGADVHLTIVHVVVALITVKVNFEESLQNKISCGSLIFAIGRSLLSQTHGCQDQGGFQLLDLIITVLKSHMTC